jgi:SAM-dependent methyltransferase
MNNIEEESISDRIDMVYGSLEGCEDVLAYHERHGTPSLLILTQCSPKVAIKTAELLGNWIAGKDVIEIGAGVGFLAIEMAKRAKTVTAIEVDPAWSWIFTRSLYRHKPANLTWIFGSAESMIGKITGDVCLVFTRSGVNDMREVANKFAPIIFFPFQDCKYFENKEHLVSDS